MILASLRCNHRDALSTTQDVGPRPSASKDVAPVELDGIRRLRWSRILLDN